MSALKYRSDIDGLRAVAVLGVVIYHAFPHALPGGFTGVDIFFVISGYLISGILYKGHNAGNFSFKEFYARRIRRLFPALITVLLLCMGYGWIVLLPDEFRQLGKHVAAGTLFIQNLVFWQESGYFDTAANLKPLLHLWSLAVEEQFYIFFPPLLLLIWKRKWPLVAIMGMLMIATFILNLVMSVQNSTADFFLTPYRAWEFLGGSLLAWWHEERVKKLGGVARGQGILDGKAPASENPPMGFDRAGNTARRGPLSSPEGLGGFSSWPALDQAGQARCGDCHSPPSLAKLENHLQRNPSEFLHTLLDKGHEEEVPMYREAMSWVGLLLLGLGMGLLHKENPYPGWRALLPVAGTLLLMEGGGAAWVNRKILSNPAVVWIGLISYPLYLFHWPALSFVHIVKGENPNPSYTIGALLVSFVLTVMTYYFIEKQIRHNKSVWTVPALVGAFLLVGSVGYAIRQKGLFPRLSGSLLQEYSRASQEHNFFDGFSPSKFSEHIWLHEAGGRGPKTLYIGDSHAQQCMPRILELLKSGRGKDRGTVFLTIGLVVPIPGATGPLEQAQQEMIKGMEEFAGRSDVDRIVLSANWKYFFGIGGDKYTIDGIPLGTPNGTHRAIKELMDQLGKYVQAGKKTYLILSIPTAQALDPKNIIERGFDGSFTISRHDPTLNQLFAEKTPSSLSHGEVMELFNQAAASVGVEVIDPTRQLSSNGFCFSLDEQNRPIYCDPHHLRSSYVRDHASYLDKTILP
jgi:peptidoglycan/LPS O-acetylase OafA/YrhL